MSMFLDDLRASVPRAVKVVAVSFLAFFVIGGVIVAGAGIALHKAALTQGDLDSKIPLTQYAPGIVQVFGCVRVGPECTNYKQSMDYLTRIAPEGFNYTPLHASDPGSPTGDGTKHVTLNQNTSRRDIRAVAAAVTLNGRVSTATVTPDTVHDKPDQKVAYAVPASKGAPARSGIMSFGSHDGEVTLLSVVYANEAG